MPKILHFSPARFCICLTGILLTLLLIDPFAFAQDNPAPRRKPDVKAWKAAREQGKKALEEKQYSQAAQSFKAALDEARNFDAKDDRLADSLFDLGNLYTRSGHYDTAEPLLRQLVDIRHGDPNPSLEAQALADFALVCHALKKYDEAARAYSQMEEILSRKLGADHPLVIDCRFRRATVYFDAGDYAQAEPLLKRCDELFEHPATRIAVRKNDPAAYGFNTYRQTFRPNYANALEALSRLGFIYIQQNRLADAQACLQGSLKIVDQNANENDPVFAETLKHLSGFYIFTTNYTAAEPILQRLIKLQEKNPGPTSAATLQSENSLADIFEHENKTAEAGALYRKILSANDETLGPDSRESALALAHLAKFYFDQKQYEQAEPLYARQVVHMEKFQGADVTLNPMLADQVVIYTALGRDSDLVEVYRRQAAVYEKMFGPDSKALIKPLTARAAILRKTGQPTEAAALETRLQALQAK